MAGAPGAKKQVKTTQNQGENLAPAEVKKRTTAAALASSGTVIEPVSATEADVAAIRSDSGAQPQIAADPTGDAAISTTAPRETPAAAAKATAAPRSAAQPRDAQAGAAQAETVTATKKAGAAQPRAAKTAAAKTTAAKAPAAKRAPRASAAKSAVAATGSAATGAKKAGSARANTAKTGAAQTADAKNSAAENSAAENSAVQTEAVATGAAQTGTSQTGAAETSAAQTGTAQSGTAKAGAAPASKAKAGAAKTSAARAKSAKAGSASARSAVKATAPSATAAAAEASGDAAATDSAAPQDTTVAAKSTSVSATAASATAASGSPIAVTVSNLVKSYGEEIAVTGVSFEVPKGVMYGIVGPNGAGKTSTLSMLAGLVRPDSGSVQVGEIDVWADPNAAKRLMGILPDRLRLFDQLTGAQFLYYAGTLRGIPGATVRARIVDLAEAFGLRDVLGKLVRQYSVGMAKKVALAAAMIHSPRLLILDEPFESVDPVSTEAVLTVLRNYVAHGGTVILSSHEIDLIERECASVAIIIDGAVRAAGTLAEVRGESSLSDTFHTLTGESPEAGGMAWLHSFSD